MRISSQTLALINVLRDLIPQDHGNLGKELTKDLSRLPDFETARATAGYYVTPDGDITDDHWWLVMDDDSIFDASGDEPVHCSKKDSRHGHYTPYTRDKGVPVGVLQFADKLRGRKRASLNKSFTEMVEQQTAYVMPEEGVTQQELNMVHTYADRLFAKVGIDVQFTRHFLDRVNDPRNKKPITAAELVRLFKQEYLKHGRAIARLGPDAEAVMTDMRTDINVPFALEWDPRSGMLDLISKTVMRKKGFGTSDQVFAVEASGASPSSGVARQAPEALPDAMTMGGQEGMSQGEPDEQDYKPEDMQTLGWDDLLDEDDGYEDDDYEEYQPQEYTIPTGTDLYHGTSAEDWNELEEDINPPFWVTEVEADALFFMNWNYEGGQSRMLHFQNTNPLKVVLFNDRNDMEEFSENTGIDMGSPGEAAEDMCARGYDGWIVPDNYEYGGSDIMICNPTGIELIGTENKEINLDEDSSVPQPDHQDVSDAIDHINQFDDTNYTTDDFELTFQGYMHPNDMEQYDDFSSWVEVDPGEDPEEEMQFRGNDWAQRAKGWGTNNIPPIIIAIWENGTAIADGRGRVQMAIVHDIKIPVYFLKQKRLLEVDHPEFMAGGDETHGWNGHDPTYDERSTQTNTGFPSP